MEIFFGDGEYIEEAKRFQGIIVLSEYKLFLKSSQGELAQTYIPLEKINRVRRSSKGVEIRFKTTVLSRYCVLLRGEKEYLNQLVREIVKRRNLKKRFFLNEWVEV